LPKSAGASESVLRDFLSKNDKGDVFIPAILYRIGTIRDGAAFTKHSYAERKATPKVTAPQSEVVATRQLPPSFGESRRGNWLDNRKRQKWGQMNLGMREAEHISF
jgi:hypothetical protein